MVGVAHRQSGPRPALALLAAVPLMAGSLAAREEAWQLVGRTEGVRLLGVASYYGRYLAVGERGAIYASEDGTFWNHLASVGDVALFGVAMSSPKNACVVGAGGFAAITKDGGREWSRRNTGVDVELRDVSFGNENVGCAVGVKGVLLMTFDGGRSWERSGGEFHESLFGVWMTSPHEVWAVGERGFVTHSTDAGKTWGHERFDGAPWMYDVTFADGIGWVVGRNGRVMRRMLGRWDPIPMPDGAGTLYGVTSTNGRTVCAVGAGGQAWVTADAGLTWRAGRSMSEEDLFAVSAAGRLVWAVGASDATVSSLDSGVSWAKYPLVVRPSFLAADFADDDFGLLVGRSGVAWSTRDGGRTWMPLETGTDADLVAVAAVTRHAGFAAGGGEIFKTENGGRTWRAVHEAASGVAGLKPALHDLFFFDRRRGWAVGSAGLVLSTSDGGETWRRHVPATAATILAVWFASPSDGVFVTDAGTIFRSESRGWRWAPVPAGTGGEALHALYFLDADHGWAVGDGGLMLWTEDGGRRWGGQRLGGSLALRDVWFHDERRGWIVGWQGVLMRTWDGGRTWIDEPSPVAADFSALGFSSADRGVAVGTQGEILAYHRGENVR